ncbi:PLDc N-terminal domain-containing protein [Corynebacterium kroppenstedtii]|uniref:PLDc N-terminal domain-containing protein n=1 Tax=Corynebacterium sp. PCR 32 TaxID=3351342 RepID=UPI0030B1E63F
MTKPVVVIVNSAEGGIMNYALSPLILAGSDSDAFGPAMAVGLVALIAIPLVIFVAAFVSIVASKRYTAFGKIVWIVVTFTFPLLGPIVWFLWGKNAESLDLLRK